ncbi:MAG: 50S ribosomal protein L10 [Proteobacteria bacterium]|nr:50S ribosomal protein L10 [Pseudomonadota bacterium]
MEKQRKVEEVKSLSDRLEKAKVLIFADYRGLKVSEMTNLRGNLRKGDTWFKVVKNRLMKRALKQMGFEHLEKYFTGPTAVAINTADPVNPAKALVDFAKDHEKLSVKGGFLDGKEIGPAEVETLARMPSREVLLARALASMNAPAANFVGVLSAVPRKLVYAINAVRETKQA